MLSRIPENQPRSMAQYGTSNRSVYQTSNAPLAKHIEEEDEDSLNQTHIPDNQGAFEMEQRQGGQTVVSGAGQYTTSMGPVLHGLGRDGNPTRVD